MANLLDYFVVCELADWEYWCYWYLTPTANETQQGGTES